MTTISKVTKVGLIHEYFSRYQTEVSRLTAEGASAFRQKLSRLPIDDLARDDVFCAMLGEELGDAAQSPSGNARANDPGARRNRSGRHEERKMATGSASSPRKQEQPPAAKLRKELQRIIPIVRRDLFEQSLESLSRREILLDPSKGVRMDLTGLWWPAEMDPSGVALVEEQFLARSKDETGEAALETFVRSWLSGDMVAATARYEKRIEGFCAVLDEFFSGIGHHYVNGQLDFLARVGLLTEFFKVYRSQIAALFAPDSSPDDLLGLRSAALNGDNLRRLICVCAAVEAQFYRSHEQSFIAMDRFATAELLASHAPLIHLDLSRSSPLQVNRNLLQVSFSKDQRVALTGLLQPLWDASDEAADNNQACLASLQASLTGYSDLHKELLSRLKGGEHPFHRKGWSIAKRAIQSHFQRKDQEVQDFCRHLVSYLDAASRAVDRSAGKGQIRLKEEHQVFDLHFAIPALGGQLHHRVDADVMGFLPEVSYEEQVGEQLAGADNKLPLESFKSWVETKRNQYHIDQQKTLEQGYTMLFSSLIDQIHSYKELTGRSLGRELLDQFLPKMRERLATSGELALQDLVNHLITFVRLHVRGRVLTLGETFAVADHSSFRLLDTHVSSKLGLKVDLVYSYTNLSFPLLYVPIRINCTVKENLTFDAKKGPHLTVKRLGRMLADISELMRSDRADNIKNLLLMAVEKTHDYLETDRFFPQVVRNFGGAEKPAGEPLFIYKAHYDSRYLVLDQDTPVHRKYQKALDQLKAESVTRNYADYLGVSSQARDYKREIVFYTGPTNSGKSYEAFNLLAQGAGGVYLAPLRLLALEGKEEIVKRGKACNLLTGEEEELMEGATFSAQTIETIDLERHYEIGVIDEIQMIEDASRGWAWSQAFAGLNARKLILTGSSNALPIVESISRKLGDSLKVIPMARKNPLIFSDKAFHKRSSFKPGTAIIAFTRKKILEIRDDLVQHGHKVAVVYGALSPETRRLEAQRFRTGESNLLVSTDAIGMGLNLPISQVLFAQSAKFDGIERRDLTPNEVIQIGGRAGRFGITDKEDGMVGFVTGFCPHLEPPVLREGFERASRGLDDVKCGYVVPNFAQVLEAKEIFSGKPLSMILKIIAANLEFSEDWAVLCHEKMEDMIQKTRLLEDHYGRPENNQLAKLPFTKLWRLISAPCDLELLKDYYINLAGAVITGSDPFYPDLPPLPVTKGTLERAEFTIKQLTIYSWFARRFKKHIPPGIDPERNASRYFGIETNGLFEPVERTDADRERLSHAISKAIKDERRLAPTFGFGGRPR